MFHINICCSARKVAHRDGVARVNPNFLLFNDGSHLYVADQMCLSGEIFWRWIRYQDFSRGNIGKLDNLISTKNVTLRHLGHFRSRARVTVRHYLGKVYGKHNKIEMMRDWQMSFIIPPNKMIFVCTKGKSVFAFM